MTITEKVAYLKGLEEGLKLDTDKNEGKLIQKIIEVLEDMSLTVSDLDDEFADLCGQVDEIDDDLAALEDDYYGPCDDDGCDECDQFEVECPECGEVITLGEDDLDSGEINCPKCGEKLEFDLDDLDEGDEDDDEKKDPEKD